MKTELIDTKQLLRDEFSKRSANNSNYSLRAFAKSLGISHTVLSLVMSGKRPLSKKAAEQIAEKLALSPVQTQLLIHNRKGGVVNPSTTQHLTRLSQIPVYEYDTITLETFTLMSDWIHYAILSLLEVDSSKFDPKWIAKRLNVSEMVAKAAMERLVSLGFVAKEKNKWKQTTKPIKVENKDSTAATKRFQKQLLEKAMESLESDPKEVRDFSSITLAIDPTLIPYAQQRIREFRRELTADLESKGNAQEVYNLTVQIYPVSKKIKE